MPCLLLKNMGLVKSVKFKNHRYIGDPINAVKIFNDKKADELIFLDITATEEKRSISLKLVEDLGEECNMPFSVGGGIKSIEIIKDILSAGAEKVSINSYAFENPSFIRQVSDIFGSQSIIVSIDVKKNHFGKYTVFINGGLKQTKVNPIEYAKKVEEMGAGEILINSIDNDGLMKGYDVELLKEVADAVHIPVIACGGAGKLKDLEDAIKFGHASAVAAGSMFVYHGPRNAVLINFPSKDELTKLRIY